MSADKNKSLVHLQGADLAGHERRKSPIIKRMTKDTLACAEKRGFSLTQIFEKNDFVFLSVTELIEEASDHDEWYGSRLCEYIQQIDLKEIELERFNKFCLCEDNHLPGVGRDSGFRTVVIQGFTKRTVIFLKSGSNGLDESLLVSKLIDQKSFPHIKVVIEKSFLKFIRITSPVVYAVINIKAPDIAYGYEFHEVAINNHEVQTYRDNGSLNRSLVGVINNLVYAIYDGDNDKVQSSLESFYETDTPISLNEKAAWQATSIVAGLFHSKEIGCLADLKLLPGDLCGPGSKECLDMATEAKNLLDKAWNLISLERGDSSAFVEAAKYSTRGAFLSDQTAQHNLGLMYLNGHGVARSEPRAIYWLTKSARQENREAESTLGRIYLERNRDSNEFGDLALAAYYLERAVLQGNENAASNLEVANRVIEFDNEIEHMFFDKSRITAMIQHLKRFARLPPVVINGAGESGCHDWLQHMVILPKIN